MFLRNCWYAATWSKDLGRGPFARTLLNEPVVMYRKENGVPVALADRCCHRAAPLSRGVCVGDRLECGYHGLRYDPDGKVAVVPGQSSVPPGAAVKAYPLREKWNVVWIWMGDPGAADEALIPDLFWLDDPAWVATPGHFHMAGNYQLIIDNLLDLTHVIYLHKNTIAGDPAEAVAPTRTERLENGVRVGRWMIDIAPPPLFARAGGFDANVDRWQQVTWHPPSNVYLDIGCAATGTGAPEGDRGQGISIWSTHLVTPETETTSYYHWAYARDFRLEDDALTKMLFEGSRDTFYEDVEMVAAQQQRLDGASLDGLIDINADNAQLQARSMLAEMILAQSSQFENDTGARPGTAAR